MQGAFSRMAEPQHISNKKTRPIGLSLRDYEWDNNQIEKVPRLEMLATEMARTWWDVNTTIKPSHTFVGLHSHLISYVGSTYCICSVTANSDSYISSIAQSLNQPLNQLRW